MNPWMQTLIVAAAVLGGLGVSLLMPRGRTGGGGGMGAAFSVAALALVWVIWFPAARGWAAQQGAGEPLAFYPIASLALVAAVMTITRRNPVASALWFAAVVILTAMLYLVQDAQFLAAATVIVYAGAIIVMFLFVIMLAQPGGAAVYDRVAREPLLGVGFGFLLLTAAVSAAVATYAPADFESSVALATWPVATPTGVLGFELFAHHGLSVEVAGTMLLVAMVGAIVIAARHETYGGPRAAAPGRAAAAPASGPVPPRDAVSSPWPADANAGTDRESG
jgi:NADH-quinone oxidoreductase subunit J